MPKTGRFYVSQDDDGHKYVIPWDKRQEWENFVDSSIEGTLSSDEMPDYAVRIDGGMLTFCSWKIQ